MPSGDQTGPPKRTAVQRSGLRRLFGRGAMLLIGAVSTYLVAPAVLEVFSSWSALGDLELRWFVLVAVAQLLAFASLRAVQRLALETTRWGRLYLHHLQAPPPAG